MSQESSTPSAEASDVVTFVFPGMNGNATGVCRMAYTGLQLKNYLHDYPLRMHGLSKFMHKRGKAFNRRGERVRLWYAPEKGDVIVLQKTLQR